MMTRTMNNRKSYVPLDNRYTERVAITCCVRYSGEISTQPHRGEGLTKNISVSGCHVISDRPVTRGTLLTLTIALPDGLPQLLLKSAHVVWVSGCQFSVRFMDVSQDHRKRLQSFIWKSISHHTVSNQRTRFRLM
jgi:c-di-GMP-binding flagellar brake protein YcgR